MYLCVCVVQIFDKALDEPSYSSMYAQLCSRLHTYNPNSDINKDKQNTVSQVCVCLCVRAYSCVCVCVHACVCMHSYMQVYVRICMYAHML